MICSGSVKSVAFSPDGERLASGSFDDTLRVWDPQLGCQLVSLHEPPRRDGYQGCVASLTFHPSASLLAYITPKDEVRIRETEAWQLAIPVNEPLEARDVLFSPDGRVLALGLYEGWVCLWDVWGRAPLHDIDIGFQPTALAFSPDSAVLAVATRASTVRLIDVATGASLCSLPDEEGEICGIAFSPDSRQFLTACSNGSLKLRSTESWEQLWVLHEAKPPITAVAMSPDGIKLAWGRANGEIRLHHLGRFTDDMILEGHRNFVLSLVFSPDGNQLASGGQDCAVRVWTIEGAKGAK